MEKHSMNVNAYRTETSFTTKGQLISTIELIVPAEEVVTLREMHSLQEIRPVTYLLSVAHRETGEHRALNLHSKGSKMKDFVPVVILTKRAESSDDLNSLFDASTYELTLDIEVAKDEAPLFDDEQEPQQPGTVNAGVLNAPREVQALPSSEDVQEASFEVLEDAAQNADIDAVAFLERCDTDQLRRLLTAVNEQNVLGKTPSALGLRNARTRLVKRWAALQATEAFTQVKAELDAQSTKSDEDMPFPDGGEVA